jgi:hypothetical protein
MSDTPHDPTDERDPRIAALLETEPLDNVTRARLVRTAMAATPPKAVDANRQTHWYQRANWIAAAALIVVVVVAIGLVSRNQVSDKFNEAGSKLSSGNGSSASDERAEAKPFEAVTPASGAASLYEALGIVNLGELGDVGSAAKLRGAVTAELPAEAKTDSTASAPQPQALNLDRRVLGDRTRCEGDANPPSGDTVAVGSGTVDSKSVTVAVVEKKDGTRLAFAADANGCIVGKPVNL